MAKLHPQLAQDCLLIGHFPLCRLLLMQDANYPWFILVPDRDNIREIHELPDADQQQLLAESNRLARALTEGFHPDKLNIAALGNIVPQLHIHHIARFHGDPAWPAPVWGKVAAKPYESGQLEETVARLTTRLGTSFVMERPAGERSFPVA